jgi:hypothetical protein
MMFFSDENIPLLIASLAFVVICLVSMGIIIHFRGVRYRREMIEKIRSADSDWSVIENDAPLEISGGSGGAFVRFLSAIGMKTNPGRSVDDADIKLKFLRAGLKGRNVPTVFWGTKFLLAVLLPLAFLMGWCFFSRPCIPITCSLAACFLPCWACSCRISGSAPEPLQEKKSSPEDSLTRSICWWCAWKQAWVWMRRSAGSGMNLD